MDQSTPKACSRDNTGRSLVTEEALIRTRPSLWTLWPTLAATWVAFSYVISFQGLFIWVIGGSILTAGVVLPLALAHRRLLAVIAVLVSPLVIAGLAELLGGESAGPITRSGLMASGVTGAMSLVLCGRYPRWIVPLSIVLLGGALGLGAANRVFWLVGVWTVAAALALSMLGPYRQEHLRERRRLIPFAAMLSLSGVVAIVVLIAVNPFIGQPWTIPGSGQVESSSLEDPLAQQEIIIEVESLQETTEPAIDSESPLPDSSEPPVETETLIEKVINWFLWSLVSVLFLILLILVYALVRRLVVSIRWFMLRFRLRRGTPEEQIAGAWTWVRLRRAKFERPLPLWMSPDIAADWARVHGEPELGVVAANASLVAFSTDLDVSVLPTLSESSWAAAVKVGRTPPGSLRQRWRWLARAPRVSDLSCVVATS